MARFAAVIKATALSPRLPFAAPSVATPRNSQKLLDTTPGRQLTFLLSTDTDTIAVPEPNRPAIAATAMDTLVAGRLRLRLGGRKLFGLLTLTKALTAALMARRLFQLRPFPALK